MHDIFSDISAVSLMISYDHPELLHLDIGKGININLSSDGYNTYAEVRCDFDRKAVNCGIPRISVRGRTQRERAYDILSTLIKSIDYDLRYNCQSAFSAIYYRKAVCSGYSALYKIFLDRENIECVIVSGIGRSESGSQDHSWVRCVLDGSTYFIDPTWCDPIINGVQNHVVDNRFFGFNPRDNSHIEQYDYMDHFMGRVRRNGWYNFNKSNNNVNTNHTNEHNRTRNSNVQNNRTNNNNVTNNQNTRSTNTSNNNDGGLFNIIFSGGFIAVCIKLFLIYFVGKNLIKISLTFLKGIPSYVSNIFRLYPSLKWIVIAAIIIFLISKSKDKK